MRREFLIAAVSVFLSILSPCAMADGCREDLLKIKKIPMKSGMPVSDKAYLRLIREGVDNNRCLVMLISDETVITPNPQESALYSDATVGDIAVEMLARINKVDFILFAPDSVKRLYAKDGAYGYYGWVSSPGNSRIMMKSTCRYLSARGLFLRSKGPPLACERSPK